MQVFQDRWIPRPFTFISLLNLGLSPQARVADLLTSFGAWNMPLLSQYFTQEDCEAIMSIPLGLVVRLDDRKYWFFAKDGK